MAIRQTQDNIENDPAKVGTHWSVRNPHPDFDPENSNGIIMNEFGHTRYPKYVDHPTKKQIHFSTTYIDKDKRVTNRIETDFPEKVLVNSKEEEDAILAGKEVKTVKIVKGWNK